MSEIIINNSVFFALNFDDFCREDSVFTCKVSRLVRLRECDFNVKLVARFYADKLIFKAWNKCARAKDKLMAFHRAAVKSFAVHSADKVDKDCVTFFGFGCFSFFLVRFLTFAKLGNFFFKLFIVGFMCQARELKCIRLDRLELRNRFDSQLIFEVSFAFCDIFAIGAHVDLRLSSRTKFIVINCLLRRLIDGLFNDVLHDALTEHFTDMRGWDFTGAEAFERDLRLHLFDFGLKLRL